MKKVIITAMLALGASSAMAVTGTAFTGNEAVTVTECALIQGTVTLGVSASVHGAYGCDEATNVIRVSACHEGGSRSATNNCAQIGGLDTPVDDTDDTFNYPWCDASNVGTIPATVGTINYTAYVVGSAGGSVAGVDLGGRCSATTIVGTAFWQ